MDTSPVVVCKTFSLQIVENDELSETAKSFLLKQLKENSGYCPCSLVKTDDFKCICKAFMEQDRPGICHCGLYKKIAVEMKQ